MRRPTIGSAGAADHPFPAITLGLPARLRWVLTSQPDRRGNSAIRRAGVTSDGAR